MVLFVGDDWAQDHHDVELMNPAGKRLTRARLPEGVDGIARFHALVAEHLGEDADAGEVVIGIETDRGPWVAALIAAGYAVFAVNPLQAARYRDRHTVSDQDHEIKYVVGELQKEFPNVAVENIEGAIKTAKQTAGTRRERVLFEARNLLRAMEHESER